MSTAIRKSLRKEPFTLGATVERVLNLADGEGARALRLCAMIFVMSAAMSLLKAAQGGIFLSAYPRQMIPWAFASSALALTVMSMITVALSGRTSPPRLAMLVLGGAAAMSVMLRGLLALALPGTPFIVYVLLDAGNGLVVMQTWGIVSGAVDPRSAKRILPIAGVGSSVAWTLSGFLTSRIVGLVGVNGLLLLAPILLGVSAWLVQTVARRDLSAAAPAPPKTSLLEGWRSGFEFVTQVPLMRLCLILSVLALLGEQMMDFQLLSSARERYVAPAAIAVFFGRFYGITSAVSLFIQLALSSRILARLGATRGLLITPAATALFALGVILVPGFAPIVLLRANDRVLKGALWLSALEQTQTPLPLVRRAQARALSRGVVAPLAYALAALGLAALPATTDVRLLSLLIMVVLAFTITVVLTGLRRAYDSALRRAIDDRRLRLDGEMHETALDREAAETIASDLLAEDEGKALLAAELLVHADPAVAETLFLRGLSHEAVAVRVTVLEGLTQIRTGNIDKVAALLLHDPSAEVRRAAVRCLAAARVKGTVVYAAFESGLADSDAEVRAACRVGLVTLEDFTGAQRSVALVPLLEDGDPNVIVAALAALGPRSEKSAPLLSALRRCLADAAPRVRLATLQVIATLDARELLDAVAPLLADPRTTEDAVAKLLSWDEDALEEAAKQLPPVDAPDAEADSSLGLTRLIGHRDATVHDRAVRALLRLLQSGRSEPLPRVAVQPVLEIEVAASFRYLSLLAGVAHDDGTPDWEVAPEYAFLGGELELRFRVTCKRVMDLLGLMQPRRLSSVVALGLRRANSSQHTQMNAQLAELLELALPLPLARRVVPLIDKLSLRERLGAAERVNLIDHAAIDDPLAFFVALSDTHLRVCAMLSYAARAVARYPDQYKEDEALLPVFERMRFLRSVPLFAEIPGEELRMVAEIVDIVDRGAGDVVFRKGDPGEDMYVIVQGRVAIRDGEINIATLGAREFFGELSLIDQEARSADAVILEATELLRLRSADLGELMARRPQIQEQILLVLVRRLRALNARVAH